MQSPGVKPFQKSLHHSRVPEPKKTSTLLVHAPKYI